MRLTLDLNSDNFQCFNHRDELDSAVQQLPNFRSVVAWHAACMTHDDGVLYLALFIPGIT